MTFPHPTKQALLHLELTAEENLAVMLRLRI